MAENKKEEQWRRADEEVRKNLPPGVKLVRTLRGHTGSIRRIAWSPNGRMLASPSDDNTIRLWDAETGGCLCKLKADFERVYCVAFDPASRILASACGNMVQIWDVANRSLLR